MSEGKMQLLIDKVRREYPKLTNKKGDSESYVYFVINHEFLVDVGRSTQYNDAALSGQLSDIEHPKSGIAMMASAYHRRSNNIYYVLTTKTKSAEIERELKQIEKNIKSIVVSHYGIADKKAGDTYCSGTTDNKQVADLLKKFLYENLSPTTLKELNEPMFSFTELLEIVNEDGDAWHNLIGNQKSAKLACKLLGVN